MLQYLRLIIIRYLCLTTDFVHTVATFRFIDCSILRDSRILRQACLQHKNMLNFYRNAYIRYNNSLCGDSLVLLASTAQIVFSDRYSFHVLSKIAF